MFRLSMLPEEHTMRTYGWCICEECVFLLCLITIPWCLTRTLQSPSRLIRIVRKPIWEKRQHQHHDFFNIFISFMAWIYVYVGVSSTSTIIIVTIASVLAEFYVDEYQNELKALTVNSIRCWGSLQQTVFV